ncbi:MAG: CRTAC1 family protein [Vicinamibacterales bacterium]
MGPGAGLLDFDNDGDLDVYLVQGGSLAGPRPGAGGRLFRNDLVVAPDGTRTLRFVDVTEASGIRSLAYGMGVATGDVDNDGWTDLYLTNVGRNQLWRNNGDGTFRDLSDRSGTAGSGWAVSASFLDYDRDGWLDLYVGYYLRYTVAGDRPCTSPAGTRDYCAPQVYPAERDRLYRNNRDGTFTDVSSTAIADPDFGPALGVVALDADDDGWMDVYVANDSQENQLWMNQRNGTFRNRALRAGVAVTADGRAEASMGVDAGDADNDGDLDLVMTELNGEGMNLYVNRGDGTFMDRSAAAGLNRATTPFTGFGTRWLDADNDGWLDLVAVNGLVRQMDGRPPAGFPYDQRKVLLRNLRDGRFEDGSTTAGPAFAQSGVGRGAAFGDLDNDGDTDIVVANDGGPAQLLVNRAGSTRHWIGLRLRGRATPRDMLGAQVTVGLADGSLRRHHVHTDGSYASASDPRILVGLGDLASPVSVRVRWPDGGTDAWAAQAVDRWLVLEEGATR